MKKLKESRNDQAEQLRAEVTATREALPFNTSSLPSRKEVHGKKKQKIKWKIKFPLVKLLALFFVLLPITVLAIYTSLSKGNKAEVVDNEPVSYSEVKGFESYSKDENKSVIAEKDKEEKEEKAESSSNGDATKEEKDTEQAEKVEQEENSQKADQVVTTEQTQTPPTTETKVEQEVEKKEETKIIEHTVQSNETIFRIAMRYFSSQDGIDIIKQYNGLSGNEIRVGQVLKIPVKQ